MGVDHDDRSPTDQGQQTARDPSAETAPDSTTWVDRQPPFEGMEEPTVPANQYLGRGVARLAPPMDGGLASELTPLSEDGLTPGLLTPGCDSAEEPRPTNGVSPTSLPDVRRALEALRAGKSVKPPGTLPYGAGTGGSESKRAVSERGTPSAVSVSTGRSAGSVPSAAATYEQVEAEPRRANVWPRRVVIGVLAVGGWVAAWAVAASHVRKANGGPVSPEPGLSRAAPPVLSAPRVRAEFMADPMVLRKIAEVPVAELTPEQWVILAKERTRVRREELEELARSMQKDSGDQPSWNSIAKLRAAVSDPQTAPEALRAMATLRGTVRADLIYEVASNERLSAETRRLASDLLGTKAVQAHVSEALRVVLDLDRVETCDEAERILGRALEVGDRRALAGLRALYQTRGCGPHKAEDCYPCLRKSALLTTSVEAVRKRAEPFQPGKRVDP